ncbi:MAG: C40 family peptidase [Pararhizobium sp.]
MSETLDRRLNAFREDLADARLEGRVAAHRFVDGEPARVVVPVADLKSVADRAVPTDSQVLMGETVRVFDRASGWCWVQAADDGYVGYIEETACAPLGAAPTHRVVVPRTFVYPKADLKFPPVHALSAGSLVTVVDEAETRGTLYYMLDGGHAIVARHCLPTGAAGSKDYVTIAEDFVETPYLWGGRSGFGIDCSGLVQLSLSLAGFASPRDSDMQAAGLGEAFDADCEDCLRRGDFVFWKGHVGIMADTLTLLHASGNTMNVTLEPLDEAATRIESLYGPPIAFRRL